MTKEEILAMEAGRGLDAQVSENVMGIKCGATLADGRLEPITMSWEDVPLYSTDISAAWQVVEKMKEEGYNLHVEYYCEKLVWTPKDKLTQVLFSNWQGLCLNDVRGNFTIPEAICKAALLAKHSTENTWGRR